MPRSPKKATRPFTKKIDDAVRQIGAEHATFIERSRPEIRNAARKARLRFGVHFEQLVVVLIHPAHANSAELTRALHAKGRPAIGVLRWPEGADWLAKAAGYERPADFFVPDDCTAGLALLPGKYFGWAEPVAPHADELLPWRPPSTGRLEPIDELEIALFDRMPTTTWNFGAPREFFDRFFDQVAAERSDMGIVQIVQGGAIGRYPLVAFTSSITIDRGVRADEFVAWLDAQGEFDFVYVPHYSALSYRDVVCPEMLRALAPTGIAQSCYRGRQQFFFDLKAGDTYCWVTFGDQPLPGDGEWSP